jgi:hypothetical protein
MDLVEEIKRAQRCYRNAKPRSARRTAKYREHVMLKVKLLRKKPRKGKRCNFDLTPEVTA